MNWGRLIKTAAIVVALVAISTTTSMACSGSGAVRAEAERIDGMPELNARKRAYSRLIDHVQSDPNHAQNRAALLAELNKKYDAVVNMLKAIKTYPSPGGTRG